MRTWHQGDRVTLKGTLKNSDDGAIVNLTGAAVSVVYWFNNGISKTVGASVTDAPNGIAEYKFAGGLSQPGFLQWLWKLTDASGDIFHSERTFKKSVKKVP